MVSRASWRGETVIESLMVKADFLLLYCTEKSLPGSSIIRLSSHVLNHGASFRKMYTIYRCKKCDYFRAIVFIKLIANSYWMPINVPIVSDVKYYHQNKYTVTLMLKVKGQVVVMKTDLMLVAD